MSSVIPKVILLTTSNLGPYHQARYSHLAQGEIELLVVKTPVREHYRPWSATEEGFRTCAPFDECRSALDVWRAAYRLLGEERPDAVVCVGYNSRFIWVMSALSRWLGVACVLYLVGWEGERSRSRMKEIIKKLYCRLLFRAAMATGERAGHYAKALGIADDRIHCVGNVVDNEYFAAPVGDEAAARFALLPPNSFLTVARLSAEKNLTTLLQSFHEYYKAGGDWHLCIAGVGPEESALKAQVPAAVRDRVHWLGWVGYEDLPALYQRAGCAVLPSYIEPWGLVANEAMAAGLPVLVSSQCGCQPELCLNDVNGYGFAPDDVKGLSELLSRIEALPPEVRAAMGQASRTIIGNYSLDSWREAFCACVNSLVSTPLRRRLTEAVNVE